MATQMPTGSPLKARGRSADAGRRKTAPESAVNDAVEMPLKEAAAVLQVSADALRGRIRRGTLTSRKDAMGTTLVQMPAAVAKAGARPAMPAAHCSTDAPLIELLAALRDLHKEIASQNAAMDRLMDLYRRQLDADARMDAQLQDMTRQVDGMHGAVKTMGAAFRLHAQETDRLIKLLGRNAGAAPNQPGFAPPPGQKQRLFGRRHTDFDDTAGLSSSS